MGKMIKFSVVDASGAAAGGQKVTAGTVELTTTSGGLAQALVDDESIVIQVNGVKVYEGPVAALKPLEVFTTTGQRRA